jgi:hypothetical protein
MGDNQEPGTEAGQLGVHLGKCPHKTQTTLSSVLVVSTSVMALERGLREFSVTHGKGNHILCI